MPNLAVHAEGVSKQYRIGQYAGGYGMLRDQAARAARRLLRPHEQRARDGLFWALRDVSFEVREGEVLGIIGKNGAGKSTLLKILSRITEPSAGFVDVYGRSSSLLEVGTGFHGELTGRENVFLNGTILGMRRAEITRKFDEIVEFAGIGRFIDTPVKRYSSGMYVRLGFAVAAHLDPDILIVDEVLSVGDAAFQKRSIDKMGEVAREGRTVMFVSHLMQTVRSLCGRAILLDGGHVVADGDTEDVVRRYLTTEGGGVGRRRWEDPDTRPGDDQCRLVEVRVTDSDGEPSPTFLSSQDIRVELDVELTRVHPQLAIGFDLVAADGSVAFRTYHNDLPEDERPELEPGPVTLRCTIPGGLLNTGRYGVSPRIALYYIGWIAQADAVVGFDVTYDHGGSRYFNAGSRPGSVAPTLPWRSA